MTEGMSGGPTARRIMVGAQLRRLREARGITREDAGYAIRGSESKISRMELGRVGLKPRDVEDLLTLYGVRDPAEREAVLSLVKESNSHAWWHEYDDVLPDWFRTYVGLEEDAMMVRVFQSHAVPGLLQTEEYARAAITAGRPDFRSTEIERTLEVRKSRKEQLFKRNPLRLWAVIDEAALRRPVGGVSVMRRQIEHLAELTEYAHVTVQVLPFRAGAQASIAGAFNLLRFYDENLPDVLYLENLVGALYLDKRDHVDRYARVMDRLAAESLPPERTARALQGILASL